MSEKDITSIIIVIVASIYVGRHWLREEWSKIRSMMESNDE